VIRSELKDIILSLVRLGIGHQLVSSLTFQVSSEVDWVALKALADQHGLSAIVLDGIEHLPDKNRPSKEELLTWIGETLQEYEYRYDMYKKAVAELAGWYNQHGLKMMVLKGFACSLDWLRPEHRPCGDIDIWQFGKQEEADALISKEKGIIIDSSHHHHTVFEWNSFSVENHYDFINVHHHKSNASFETILKELGKDDSHYVELDGVKVYLPSPNLHALFLLKHLMMHFAAEGIMLRQVLDWGFFVQKHSKEVDWDYVLEVLDKFGMKNMFNILNAICVGDFGFDVALFPTVQFDPSLKDKVLNEILSPQYESNPPKNVLKRVMFKIRRWRDNEWKHKLCYKDSMWSSFWSGVWNHLMKPSSI